MLGWKVERALWCTYKKLGSGISFERDYQSQLSKLVMNIPIIERNSKEKKEEGKKTSQNFKKKDETDLITLAFMSIIDERTMRIPSYWSLAADC